MIDQNPSLEVHDLKVSYEGRPVLWGVDFTLPQGRLIGIIGPNGSGKTTLLNTVLGIKKPDRGFVKIFDQKFDLVKKRVSYVPQKESVDWNFPASVFDVALMGRYGHLGWIKRPGKRDKEIALESLRKVGMESFKDRQISKLSGGQQQRVFLARALAQEADIYFMDEPFSGVDIATEKSLVQLMKTMVKEGKTLIVVHHDLNSVNTYFEWLIMINLRMIACGPTPEVFNEKNLGETYGGKLNILSQLAESSRK